MTKKLFNIFAWLFIAGVWFGVIMFAIKVLDGDPAIVALSFCLYLATDAIYQRVKFQ